MIRIVNTGAAPEHSTLLNINAIANLSISQSRHFIIFAVCLDTRYALQWDRYQSRCNVILEQMQFNERKSICKSENMSYKKKHLYTICSFHILSIAKFLNVGSCKSLSDSIHSLLKSLINASKKIFSVIVITSDLRQTQNNNCFPFTYNCSFSFLLLCSPSEKRCYQQDWEHA